MIEELRIPWATLQREGTQLRCLNQSPSFRAEGFEAFVTKLGPIPESFTSGVLFWVTEYDSQRVGIGRFDLSTQSGRLLQVDRGLYQYLPHPFQISDRFLADSTQSLHSDLEWPLSEGLPRRMISDLDAILKKGHGPLLLGATQAVVDTEAITLVAAAPDEVFLRDLWEMLPESIRRTTHEASYCFAETPEFHLSFVPRLPEPLDRYLDEERVLDYPDSRYERSLQIAIESGDQREVDRLFSRRSTSETVRLMLWLLLFMVAVGVAMRYIG